MNSILRILTIVAAAVFLAVPALADGVLVFGGTGRLGAETVKQVLAAGHNVTVFARPTSSRERLEGLDVAFVVGDMLNEGEMVAAFKSSQPLIVIDASALYTGGHEEAMGNLIAGAKAAGGVKQIIHHGSVGAGQNMALFPHVDFSRLREILLDKRRAEKLLVESALSYTIIRNGIIENDDTLSSGRARMTEDATALGRITRVDLASVTMDCFEAQQCANKVFHALDDNLPWSPPSAEGAD